MRSFLERNRVLTETIGGVTIACAGVFIAWQANEIQTTQLELLRVQQTMAWQSSPPKLSLRYEDLCIDKKKDECRFIIVENDGGPITYIEPNIDAWIVIGYEKLECENGWSYIYAGAAPHFEYIQNKDQTIYTRPEPMGILVRKQIELKLNFTSWIQEVLIAQKTFLEHLKKTGGCGDLLWEIDIVLEYIGSSGRTQHQYYIIQDDEVRLIPKVRFESKHSNSDNNTWWNVESLAPADLIRIHTDGVNMKIEEPKHEPNNMP